MSEQGVNNVQQVLEKVVKLDLNGNEIQGKEANLHSNSNALTNWLVFITLKQFKKI